MTRRARLPHSPHHISIYNEDWDFLMEMFGPNGLHPMGVTEIIREAIHRQVGNYRAKYRKGLDASQVAPEPEEPTE